MINTPVKQQINGETVLHPALQFLILAGIVGAGLLVFTALGIGITWLLYGGKTRMAMMSMDSSVPNFANGLWIVQIIGTTIPLFSSAIFFAVFIVNNSRDYIKSNFRISWTFYLLIFGIMVASSPLVECLSIINQKIHLPQSMIDTEKTLARITGIMLEMNTIWALLFDILVIGLLTAIAEEFLFRGCIQTIFEKWLKNKNIAIWVTAILFSAFHDEFSGFLPRLMLGLLFGYAVAWSGSIWPAVLGHFLNNASDVIIAYLEQHKVISSNFDNQQIFNNTIYLFSFIIILFLFWVYRNVATNKKPVQV